MKLEKYLLNRLLFEHRYLSKSWNNLPVNLYDLKDGIRNFELFLNIYYRDKRPFLSNIVSSIDGRKRFNIAGYPALKITVDVMRFGVINRFPEQYDKIFKYCLSKGLPPSPVK